jgi:hypothetical protein
MRIPRAKISFIIGDGEKLIKGGKTMARSQDNTIVSVVHPICCGLDVHNEMRFSWGRFQNPVVDI